MESTRTMTIPARQGIEQSMDGPAVLVGSPPGTLDAWQRQYCRGIF